MSILAGRGVFFNVRANESPSFSSRKDYNRVMIPDPADTIVALATAPGAGMRAIVRLSGPASWKIAGGIFDELPAESGRPLIPLNPPVPKLCLGTQRVLTSGSLRLPGVVAPLPADLYFWPRPASYTGQDMVELHTISSSPLVDLLVAECLKAGARAAQPGEFTLRAFLAGKRDLPRAEAVLGVIHARSRDELKHALAQLAGGLAQPLAQLREDLLNLLADVEAGLDFSDEDLSFVATEDLLKRLAHGLALLTLIRKQIEQRSTSGRPFRVVLVGPVNAGKSSLFNALVGRNAALVSDRPGTTRDFLCAELVCQDVQIELLDTAGLRSSEDGVESTAQAIGIEQARQADLLLWCEETRRAEHREVPDSECFALSGTSRCSARHVSLSDIPVLRLATKCDLKSGNREQGTGNRVQGTGNREQGTGTRESDCLVPVPCSLFPGSVLATSAVTGLGLDQLKRTLAERARAHVHAGLAPSLSRCRHHVDACLDHLRAAHRGVLHNEPAEILALEIRIALEELGAMVGTIYTDDLLDRIFSRFCIGK